MRHRWSTVRFHIASREKRKAVKTTLKCNSEQLVCTRFHARLESNQQVAWTVVTHLPFEPVLHVYTSKSSSACESVYYNAQGSWNMANAMVFSKFIHLVSCNDACNNRDFCV